MTNEITVDGTKATVTYFKNDPRYGRTTTLINKVTGNTLFVGMGVQSRRDLFKAFLRTI